MKKRLLHSVLFILTTCMAFAQHSISGKLVEKENNEPLGHATVQLFRQQDSSFVKGATSNESGHFLIESVSPGAYKLLVSFIGLAPLDREVVVKNAAVDLGNINLGAGENYLEEVVVKGVAAQVSVSNDTLEYNAVAFKVTENAVTEDLLKKMPGIEVDSEGRVFVNGEEVKKVRINGKRFFGENTKMATKNIPADLIDKIQIIDEQSEMAKLTGFEDGETTKMINITIKEDKKKGLFANLFGGYGSDDRYEMNGIANWINGNNIVTVLAGLNNTNNSRFEGIGDVSVNIPGMRISKNQMTRGITESEMIGANMALDLNPRLKLEGNYSFGSPSTYTKQKAGRETFTDSVTSQFYDRDIQSFRSGNAHNLGFRLEWKIDKSTTLIVSPDLTYSDFNTRTETYHWKSKQSGDTISRGYSLPSTSGTAVRGAMNITFSKKLKKRGRTISANLRGNLNETNTEGVNESFTLKYRNGLPGTRKSDSTIVDQYYTDLKKDRGYYLRLSYVEPIGKSNRLELSFSQRLNRTDAEKLSYEFIPEQGTYADTIDTRYSNLMESTFTNYQISLNFKRYRKKYRYTLGIKAEPSAMNSEFPLREDVKRSVFNISPSANLVYNFHKKKYLKVDYRGYTVQPTAVQLQPVPNVTNPSFIRNGNPDLNPRFTHALKATYSAYRSKDFSLLTAHLNGVFHQNAIVTKTEYLDESTQSSIPINVNGVYNVYGNLLFNKPFFDNRLTINTNTPFAFNNDIGFTKVDGQKEYVQNKMNRLRIGERLRLMHQNHFMELSAGAEISYVRSRNDVNDRQNADTYDWEYFGSVLFRLPAHISLSSDIEFSYKRGYMEAFNMDEIIWNAEIEKLVFKNKKGVVSLKIYDILQQRLSIRRTIGSNYVDDSDYNTLKSYFLVCFAYKFDFWGK